MITLARYNSIPEGLLDVPIASIRSVLPNPSLLSLKGEREAPLFICTLLHGNEPSGFLALQQLLNYHHRTKTPLPRSLLVFIGNVEAAEQNVRRLPEQLDYNRVWIGGDRPEHHLVADVMQEVRAAKPFASIDIHNNTGENPFYACINALEDDFLELATHFSDKIVYFTSPHEVQSMAMKEICPSVTVECGHAGEMAGVAKATEYLEAILSLDSFSNPPSEDQFSVFHTFARIYVPSDATIAFGDRRKDCDYCFIENFDSLNFTELPPGTLLGWSNNGRNLEVRNPDMENVTEEFLYYEQGEIRTKQTVVASMFTKDIKTIHQDCLGYFMERVTR